MKKVLIIVGCVAVVGFLLLMIVIFAAVSVVRKAEGPALYSSIGAWTRIQEYAHARGKTNYIDYADNQVATIQGLLDDWQKTAGNVDLAKLHRAETNAYATVDKNIKSGINPLAFLDETNFSITPAASAAATNQ